MLHYVSLIRLVLVKNRSLNYPLSYEQYLHDSHYYVSFIRFMHAKQYHFLIVLYAFTRYLWPLSHVHVTVEAIFIIFEHIFNIYLSQLINV